MVLVGHQSFPSVNGELDVVVGTGINVWEGWQDFNAFPVSVFCLMKLGSFGPFLHWTVSDPVGLKYSSVVHGSILKPLPIS